MPSIENLEMKAHRPELVADVKELVEKYRAIFDWDIAEIDQRLRDHLILGEIRNALDDIRAELAGMPEL